MLSFDLDSSGLIDGDIRSESLCNVRGYKKTSAWVADTHMSCFWMGSRNNRSHATGTDTQVESKGPREVLSKCGMGEMANFNGFRMF
jgi:hypothetical protein